MGSVTGSTSRMLEPGEAEVSGGRDESGAAVAEDVAVLGGEQGSGEGRVQDPRCARW